MKNITSPILNHVVRMRDFIFDILFPVLCLVCKKEGDWLCEECFRQLEINIEQVCHHCKKINTFGGFCANCQVDYHLDGVLVAGDYNDKIIKKLIKSMKYKFLYNLDKQLGKYLCIFLNQFLYKCRIKRGDIFESLSSGVFKRTAETPQTFLAFRDSLLIPVPLHKKRLNWRGFNQAEKLANRVSRFFDLEINNTHLIRVKHKKAQAKLGEIERRNNVKNCFAWRGSYLNSRNIILLDDVVSTASTLDECARVLKTAGAGEVWGLVVARG